MKYSIEVDGTAIISGFYDGRKEESIHKLVDFIRSKVKDGVKVELCAWSPNR